MFFLPELLQLALRFSQLENFPFQLRDVPICGLEFRHSHSQGSLQPAHPRMQAGKSGFHLWHESFCALHLPAQQANRAGTELGEIAIIIRHETVTAKTFDQFRTRLQKAMDDAGVGTARAATPEAAAAAAAAPVPPAEPEKPAPKRTPR